MNNRHLSHDILNILERLRIMHDLIKDKNYSVISEEEMRQDLDDSLKKLKEDFEKLFQ
ncbi:MAG: hypothetical protein AB7I27_06500 [Bacteriovoracaceae bacterium]